MKKMSLLLVSIIALVMTGCASMVINEDNIRQKTAFTLGLDKDDFTVYDRVDEGVQANYKIKTKKGKVYNCYVTGSFSVVGKTISDAVCRDSKGKYVGERNALTQHL